MKAGMKIGDKAFLEITVTPEMFAQFEGTVVHPVYSTVSMVYHMEWVSRKIILPFLEEDEEGMGSAVSVKHIAPSGEGILLKLEATVVEVKNHIVYTKVEVKNTDGLIGVGEVKQVILPKNKISELISSTTA
ncbi:thioesterase family protein [Bacillus sp. 2205SS5-2]|uniref:thioesterase family protein n=1 Tax=Bacillus sp. 2205SS5-2 TaxID=3109031 RepID=UPI003003E3EE